MALIDGRHRARAVRQWATDGITANALMPGGIKTQFQEHAFSKDMSDEMRHVWDNYPWRTAAQGAATSVLVAASPLPGGASGWYFENSGRRPEGGHDPPEPHGVAACALDAQAAGRL